MTGADNLSTAQAETYAMLLNMGFEGSNAVSAARIFGSDVSAAVNYLTSEPPPSSAFYQPQASTYSNNNSYGNNNNQSQTQNQNKSQTSSSSKSKTDEDILKRKRKNMSPDDIAIEEFLAKIARSMQETLDDDDIMASTVKYLDDQEKKKKELEKEKEKANEEYKPKSKEEEAFDEKTNQQIINITKRMSLTKEQLQSQVILNIIICARIKDI